MDWEAWTDSALVREIEQGFVPVRVNADRRPDIADRYLAGGWPTTVVLTPEGHVLAAQSVIAAQPLRRILAEVRDRYWKNRQDIERRAAESARRIRQTWESEPLEPPEVPLTDWIDQNISALKEAEDRVHGGLRGEPKLPRFEAVRFLLTASAAKREPELRDLAFRLLDAAAHLEDSLWGGYFRFAGSEEWKRPHTEKLLSVNARAIEALARAAETEGGARFRAAARRTEEYAAAWLWSERLGGWFGSQDADLIARNRSEHSTSGDIYYGLSNKARRARGAPQVDSALYAEANARMASAVLRGAEAGVWKGAPVKRAIRALDRLWSKQRAPGGSLYHAWVDGRGSVEGLLADQAAAALAYLDAYHATKEPRHLERAEALAKWIRERLEDRVGGGFRYAPRDSTAIGRLAAGDKPELGNVDAAWLFLRLWKLHGRAEDRRSAERTLDFLRQGDVLVLDPAQAELGLELERATAAERSPAPARGDP